MNIQLELPDLREAIIAHDSFDKPAIIVMGGNGIGRGPYQDLWARGFRHLLPGESMASSASDDLKIRRFSEGLFSLYEGLVRLPNAMPGRALETLLAEIAAFPDGKHDDQVDALSEGHLRGPSLGPQPRPSRAAARQGPDRLAQIARSGALRPATMGSGLTRSQEATFTRKSFRWVAASPPRRLRSTVSRGDLRDAGDGARAEQPRRGRRSRSKAQAASMLRVLTGEERNSSRSHCARDGHRFESPQLHQEVRANRREFLRYRSLVGCRAQRHRGEDGVEGGCGDVDADHAEGLNVSRQPREIRRSWRAATANAKSPLEGPGSHLKLLSPAQSPVG